MIDNELAQEELKSMSLLSEEDWAMYGEYFSSNIEHESIFPDLYYNCLMFRARDEERYFYGTIAAHAYDALSDGGYFVFNINETVHDIDQIIALFSLFFEYLPKESDSQFYVFRK